ncbi:MAG: pyridoxal-phosphate dependent enzyme [Promethearchaeota archaeon]
MQCMRCRSVFTDEESSFVCPTCTHPLNINIIHDKVGKIDLEFFNRRSENMWKYLPFLPLKNEFNIISLGEGRTPFMQTRNLGRDIKLGNLWMKNETLNPTGSFLDRNISLGISIAKEFGYNRVISLSTGNVGISVAAYAARAGFQSLIVIPRNFQKGKINQIRLFGGNAIHLDENGYKPLMNVVIKGAREYNAMNLATTSLYNAFTNHGAKTIIYEMFEQMNMELPELIVVPVGGAGLLCALIQACMELKELHFIEEIPSFLAVQPEGCHPFIQALRKDTPPAEVFAHPWKDVDTRISALASDIPFDYSWFYWLNKQLPDGRVSGIIVDDQEALIAQKEISKREGIFVELASATTYAAIKKAKEMSNAIDKFASIALVLTGAGVLDIETSLKHLVDLPLRSLDDCNKPIGKYFT